MLLILAIFLGGVLTILSPCILPVLPFVFARAEGRFLTHGLPMLVGMAAAFTGVATLAAVGGAWAIRVNQYGRMLSLILLAVVAVTLLSRSLANWLTRPVVALGNWLVPAIAPSEMAQNGSAGDEAGGALLPSMLLGVATGLLWAPCAGPILGLVLTGAALSGPNARTTFLLLAYAAGAATSLAIAMFAGKRVLSLLKRSLGAGEWVRRALGITVLVAVIAIAFGFDTSVLTHLSLSGTNRIEQALVDRIQPDTPAAPPGAAPGVVQSTVSAVPSGGHATVLPIEGELPSLSGATGWLNSPALTAESLRGKVVLIDFWTYSCINCLRSLPHVKAWWAKYRDHGLVVIGVHAPEFAFEKDAKNVAHAVADLGVTYPVAIDDDYAIWQGFHNHYWPAHYFIDAAGRIRGHHFGEGEYDESEGIIRQLLAEAGQTALPESGVQSLPSTGVEAAADTEHVQSPETYVGYRRAANFASPGGLLHDGLKSYQVPATLDLNQWALGGDWFVDPEKAVLKQAPGRVVFRFAARDLHLVLGPGARGKPVRFRVRIDGAAPGSSHGADIDAAGEGVIEGQRLYQLIRQPGPVAAHEFSIEFQDGDVAAYAFTFG